MRPVLATAFLGGTHVANRKAPAKTRAVNAFVHVHMNGCTLFGFPPKHAERQRAKHLELLNRAVPGEEGVVSEESGMISVRFPEALDIGRPATIPEEKALHVFAVRLVERLFTPQNGWVRPSLKRAILVRATGTVSGNEPLWSAKLAVTKTDVCFLSATAKERELPPSCATIRNAELPDWRLYVEQSAEFAALSFPKHANPSFYQDRDEHAFVEIERKLHDLFVPPNLHASYRYEQTFERIVP